MASIIGNKLLLPIGCSCINQFQLDFAFGTAVQSGYPFDSVVIEPECTAEILSNPTEFIANVEDLEIIAGRVRARNKLGIYFWHIGYDIGASKRMFGHLSEIADDIDTIVSKHKYLMGKLSSIKMEVHCLWSNVQPNLRLNVQSFGGDWDRYRLTVERYDSIKEKVANLPWLNAKVHFVVRADDADGALVAQKDVSVIDLPRSDDYKGPVGLFTPVFERIGVLPPG